MAAGKRARQPPSSVLSFKAVNQVLQNVLQVRRSITRGQQPGQHSIHSVGITLRTPHETGQHVGKVTQVDHMLLCARFPSSGQTRRLKHRR